MTINFLQGLILINLFNSLRFHGVLIFNTATTNRNKKVRKFKSNKENFTPIQSTEFSRMYELDEPHPAVNEQAEENAQSPKQDSDLGFFSHKNVNNLTLEEYLLNYGRPYRNNSMNRIEPVTTWRVVNEDPSESYVSVDDEFLNEIVDPLVVSIDAKRNISCDNHNIKQANSLERNTGNIKLSVLSAVKRSPGHGIRKQRSTTKVIDDFDRKISSPLLQHAMSAFFNTSKMPPPTGPKSIRMSSNASVLFPIREEGGGIGKMSINDDILDEVDSSPCSSLSSLNRLNNIDNKTSNIENIHRLD